jgi:hypothetical protein
MLNNIEKGYHKKIKMTLSTGRINVFPSIDTKFEKMMKKVKLLNSSLDVLLMEQHRNIQLKVIH